MKLSTKAKYGVYAAVYLGKKYEGGFVNVSEISTDIGVSDGYLEHIFAMLKRNGLVEAQRGAYGGYRLSRTPSEITTGEILRAVEDNLEIVDCLSGKCEHRGSCVAHTLWNNLYGKINEYLDSVTLQQLIDENEKQAAYLFNRHSENPSI